MIFMQRNICSFLLFTLVNVLKCNGEPPVSSYSAPQKDRPSPAYGPPPNGGHGGAPGGPGSRPGGAPPSSNYGPPPSPDIRPPSSGAGGGFGKPPSPGQPPGSPSDSGSEDAKPEPFSFMYEVKDAATGNDFSHKQESDGKTVKGEYKVLLPDGRNQVVTYTADDGGYNAEVKYDGEAQPQAGGGGPSGGGGSGGGGAGGYPSGGPGGFPPAGSSGYPSGGPKNKPSLELPSKAPSGGSPPPASGGSFGGYPSGGPSGSPQNSYLPPNFSGY